MKKSIAAMVAFMMAVTFTVGIAEDSRFVFMTDDEIRALIDAATEELERRGQNEAGDVGDELHMKAGTVIWDDQGITITLLKSAYVEWAPIGKALKLETVIENTTDSEADVYIHSSTINGWDVAEINSVSITAGNKRMYSFDFRITDAQIEDVNEIEKMEIVFSINKGGVPLKTDYSASVVLVP